ncbi:finTRIM family, member 14 [Silurus asotus]|uniref:FinTRIM family, member 14 n=1 Tax=Silurus asotus TaxID=30991 RepID=A0AAD5AJ31_SILAS|nr:finTRIM family, member 14 [Silurus asotus]
MAEFSISVDQLSVNKFSCPVCLDLLKDPVTIPCGHSFCKVCINGFWDQEDQTGVYSCPQCRHTFNPRPVLHRNIMLEKVMEKLKNLKAQAAFCEAGPGDVECDLCSERKRKAVKSCLMCLISFCETHLKVHYEVPSWKKHKLIEACGNLQEKVCSEHHEVLKIYCRTDRSFICYLCTMHEHRGHDTVAAAAERAEKQTQLKEEQKKFQQRIQEKQKKVQELKQDVNIKKVISFMKKMHSEVTELIRDQEKAKLSRAERLLKQLEQEIYDRQRRITELEQLSHTHDHIHFLQSFQSLSVSSGCKDSPSITVNQHLSFDRVRKSVSDLKKRFEELCQENFIIIHELDFCDLTLDPNTVNDYLILSEKNKVVTRSETNQSYSYHRERFNSCCQVLSKKSVCGRCYWEVEWSTFNYLQEQLDRGHVLIYNGSTEMKEEQKKFQQRIQEKQKKVKKLKQAVNIIKLSAQTAVDDLEVMEDQEKAELSQAELLTQQEQEIFDLQRRITKMEQLSHTHDHIHFLQTSSSSPSPPSANSSPISTSNPLANDTCGCRC